MEGIVLHLFGPPEVALPHGEPARRLASPKRLALLAFLALEPGPHPREELATLLWGDSPEPAARAWRLMTRAWSTATAGRGYERSDLDLQAEEVPR